VFSLRRVTHVPSNQSTYKMVVTELVKKGAPILGAAAGTYFGGPGAGTMIGEAVGGILGDLLSDDSNQSSPSGFGGGSYVNVQPGAWVNVYSGGGTGFTGPSKQSTSSSSSGIVDKLSKMAGSEGFDLKGKTSSAFQKKSRITRSI